ncbi:MAG: diguanylate cyclase [Rhodospirillales bacterium]|nr:diguanylate cyclase [Rhodospirillales bacterium]
MQRISAKDGGAVPMRRGLRPFADDSGWSRLSRMAFCATAGGAASATFGAGAVPALAAAFAAAAAQIVLDRNAVQAVKALGRRTAGSLNKAVFDSVADGIVGIDALGRVNFINPAAEALSGWKEAEVIGLSAAELFSGSLQNFGQGGEATQYRLETVLPRRSGEPIPVEMHLSPIVERGRVTGQIAVFHDIRERRSAEENRRLAAAVLEWSAQAIIVSDASGRIVTVNPAFSRLSGYAPEEVIGRPVSVLRSDHHDAAFHAAIRDGLERDGAWKGEIWNRRKDGTPYAVWLSITRIAADAQGTGFLVAFYFDITERKRHEERIIAAANHDVLTGLPNRRMFEERLSLAVEDAARLGQMVAVLLIDLDGFKGVNDTHGHEAGDALLKALAGRMGNAIRSSDMAARLGGDEFVVLLPDLENKAAAARVAESLSERLKLAVPFEGQDLRVSASIGIAILRPGDKPDGLLKAADQAMYAVKRSGKSGYLFFAPELEDVEALAASQAQELTHALDHGELHVLYQPIIDLADLSVNGLEASLVRRKFDGTILALDPLSTIADHEGCIIRAGNWMRGEALKHMSEWRQSGLQKVTLTFFLSVGELRRPDIVAELMASLERHGVPPHSVEISIPESSMRQGGATVVKTLVAIRRAGLRLAIDGFTGAASRIGRISALQPSTFRLSIASLSGEGKEAETAITRLQDLARAHGVRLMFTGIERPEQLSLLLGCCSPLVQGNVLSRAVPADEIPAFAATFEQTRGWKS